MTVTRDTVEQKLWAWTAWQADQRSVDDVMGVVDQAMASGGRAPGPDGRADAVLAEARNEAAQIVQAARDEAAAIQAETLRLGERPPAGLTPVPRDRVPLDVHRDADGVLWLRLGPSAEPMPGDLEKTRRCTRCRGVKVITRFSRDARSRAGRKAMCKDCENVARRERYMTRTSVSQEEGP